MKRKSKKSKNQEKEFMRTLRDESSRAELVSLVKNHANECQRKVKSQGWTALAHEGDSDNGTTEEHIRMALNGAEICATVGGLPHITEQQCTLTVIVFTLHQLARLSLLH